MIVIRKPNSMLTKLLPPVSPRPGITYIPSLFVLPFKCGGKQYLFHNLTKQCIEGTLPGSARAGESFDDLIRAQFLVPEDKDECTYYNQISSLMRANKKKNDIRNYIIVPTFACNARCVYCFEENMKQICMTPDVVEQVIRFIEDTHKGKGVRLSWFGGEPLLEEKIIDRICEGLSKAGLKYRSYMISNGSLITPLIVEKMVTRWKLTRIQISMDGAEQDYVFRKRYNVGHNYYRKVLEAVDALSAAGICVTIRCNVDENNWSRIREHLYDLQTLIRNKEKVCIYFSPLYSVRQGDNDVAMWEKILNARHLIEEAGFDCAPFMGFDLNFRVNHCMADNNNMIIGPDGSLYPCEHMPAESRFGDIWHGTTDENVRREFCRVDRTREKCRNCSFLPTCTSFAACPVEDTHCRQVHELIALDTLKRMVEKKEIEIVDKENTIC